MLLTIALDIHYGNRRYHFLAHADFCDLAT